VTEVTDLAERRQLNRGYNDGLSRAIEIVATPVLLGLFGTLLDSWLGTRPLLTLTLATLGVAGIVVKLWLGYDREMAQHEARAVWGRARKPVAAPAEAPELPANEPIRFTADQVADLELGPDGEPVRAGDTAEIDAVDLLRPRPATPARAGDTAEVDVVRDAGDVPGARRTHGAGGADPGGGARP
jgi:hypothetical protein